ncbi:MAG: 50S ribosomal protein L24 [Planctomycetota bacterium]
MAIHVKKGDTVQIIAGEHKGATGRVMRVLRKKGKVVIEGHNRKHKHVRPSAKAPQGGRILVEQPVDISNVLPVNPKSSSGTRVRFEYSKDGGKKRVALDGTEIGVIRKV